MAGKNPQKRDQERRRDVAAMQKRGEYREAFNEACQGLQGEAAEAARKRPGDSVALYTELTEQLLNNAARLPRYRPASRAGVTSRGA